jgi:hypothetical protein
MVTLVRLLLISSATGSLLLTSACNSGGFSGGSQKVEKTQTQEKKPPKKEPAKESESLGKEKEGEEIEEVEKPNQKPNDKPEIKPNLNEDVVTTTTPPKKPDPVVMPKPDPIVVQPPPVVTPTPPPAVIPPTVVKELGNLRFKAVPFINMEHRAHATEPGSWAILKSSSGAVVAAGPMTVYAACKGESLSSMAYPVVKMNVDLTYLSQQVESGQLSGQQQGSLSICLVAGGGSRDSLTCQRVDRGTDQARPSFWYDRPVTFNVGANAQIEIDNQAGYMNGMGLQGENVASGLSFAHPLQASVCGSNARGYADYNSPLVLDVNRNEKFDLSNVWQEKNPVRFDINADGKKIRTGWTTNDALLVLDVNQNGTIDSGSELFGENSHSLDGKKNNHFSNFKNGYQALSQYDQNQDGRIDSNDEVFSKLRLWVDANRNGTSEKNELKDLSAGGVKSLSLAYTKAGSQDKFFMVEMNEVRLVSSFEFTDGTIGRMADIWFASKSDETAAANAPAGVK